MSKYKNLLPSQVRLLLEGELLGVVRTWGSNYSNYGSFSRYKEELALHFISKLGDATPTIRAMAQKVLGDLTKTQVEATLNRKKTR
jgi:hypothetical protein